MSVAENIAGIRERVARAVARAGRTREDVLLMAVSKTAPAELIREAYGCGLRLFGESRIQEFEAKLPLLRDLRAEWHMIGHLQTNKAARAAELFPAVDSVDSLRLAERLNTAAAKLGRRVAVLIEINVGGESAKSGAWPDSPELESILEAAPRLEHLLIGGLMTIPPFTDDPEQARPFFAKLRNIRDQLASRRLTAVTMDVLSMGMSHDFEVAVEEGSTCVRIGTAIFGERRPRPR
jgi:pyridoxal phosphate enzyme (YggS family)